MIFFYHSSPIEVGSNHKRQITTMAQHDKKREVARDVRSLGKSSDPLRIVIAGGGTGGHLFPGIAIAQEFMARNLDSRILFVGTGRPFETTALAILPINGLHQKESKAGGYGTRPSLS
jgi:hypothetical protein